MHICECVGVCIYVNASVSVSAVSWSWCSVRNDVRRSFREAGGQTEGDAHLDAHAPIVHCDQKLFKGPQRGHAHPSCYRRPGTKAANGDANRNDQGTDGGQGHRDDDGWPRGRAGLSVPARAARVEHGKDQGASSQCVCVCVCVCVCGVQRMTVQLFLYLTHVASFCDGPSATKKYNFNLMIRVGSYSSNCTNLS